MNTREFSAVNMDAIAGQVCEGRGNAVFDVKRILEQVAIASGQGQRWYRVVQTERLDLSQTKGARRLLKRLDELGYKTRWEVVVPVLGESWPRYNELVIEWAQTRTLLADRDDA